MSKRFCNTRKMIIYWLLFCLLVFLYFGYCFLYLSEYAYRYPVVHNMGVLFLKTIPNVLLPTLLLLVTFFCIRYDKKVISIVCGCVFIIVLPLMFLRSTGEILYSPAICSYTDNPVNYGKYDKEVSQAVTLNAKGYLPETIPSEAKNVEYCYLYEKASANTTYISISWECTDNEIENLQWKHAEDVWALLEDGKQVTYLSPKTQPNDIIQPHFHAVIVYDEANNIITYTLTDNTALLLKDKVSVLLSIGDGSLS